MDNGLAPSIIISGYQKAAAYAREVLQENIIEINSNDDTILKQIAKTAMVGKTVGAVEHFTEIALKAVRQVSEINDGTIRVNLKKIAILGKQGGSLPESQLVDGMVIDKEVSQGAYECSTVFLVFGQVIIDKLSCIAIKAGWY